VQALVLVGSPDFATHRQQAHTGRAATWTRTFVPAISATIAKRLINEIILPCDTRSNVRWSEDLADCSGCFETPEQIAHQCRYAPSSSIQALGPEAQRVKSTSCGFRIARSSQSRVYAPLHGRAFKPMPFVHLTPQECLSDIEEPLPLTAIRLRSSP